MSPSLNSHVVEDAVAGVFETIKQGAGPPADIGRQVVAVFTVDRAVHADAGLLARLLGELEWQAEDRHMVRGRRRIDVGIGRQAEIEVPDEMLARPDDREIALDMVDHGVGQAALGERQVEVVLGLIVFLGLEERAGEIEPHAHDIRMVDQDLAVIGNGFGVFLLAAVHLAHEEQRLGR
jgi:hypothetical protein